MKRIYSPLAVLALAGLALSACCNSAAPSADEPQVDLTAIVEDVPTIQQFLMDPVPEADLIRIANAGVNAPSAMNRQPWHISIVSDPAAIEALGKASKEGMKFPPRRGGGMPGGPDGNMPAPPAGGMPGGPDGEMPAPPAGMQGGMPGPPPSAGGVKSGLGDSPAVIIISCNPGSEFDAGLACETMNDMANILGYGTKIVSSVTLLFNGDKKAEYYEQFQIPEGQSIVAAILLGKVNSENYDAVSSASARNDFNSVVTFVK